ncbi:MAG: LuxR C-terminal-related transcriptional regulator [Polyangiaceae bacterium]
MGIPSEARREVDYPNPSPHPGAAAAEAWHSFLRGGWLVTRHTPGPAARTVVAWSIEGLPKGDLPSAEELRVAALRAQGNPVKTLAAETGRSISRTAESLKSAMRKLLITTESELVGFFCAWPRAMWVSSASTGEGRQMLIRYMPPSWSLPMYLSCAEKGIVRALLAGHSQAAIARASGVATRTVSNQIASVYRKVNVHSRMDLFVALTRADWT